MAVRPGAFDGGLTPEDGGDGWELFGEIYQTNPKFRLTEAEWLMVDLWQLYRGGGFGAGYLPSPGAAMAQPLIMIEAFKVMDAVETELRPKQGSE